MNAPANPTALAQRCDALDQKLRRIIEGDLSASGKATAVALLVTLEANIFAECATALRARGQ